MKIQINEGDKFGRLTIVKEIEKKITQSGNISRRRFLCQCSCGNTAEVTILNLRNGDTKSCGCLWKEKTKINLDHTKHGMWKTPTYRIWLGIKSRCNNKNTCGYFKYGERGIKICERWNDSFENFFEDMGERPKGLSIERIDNNGDYCKENCRWATSKEQANNRRNNHFIEFNGEKKTVSEWSLKLGGNINLVSSRIMNGWDPIKAISTPVLIK